MSSLETKVRAGFALLLAQTSGVAAANTSDMNLSNHRIGEPSYSRTLKVPSTPSKVDIFSKEQITFDSCRNPKVSLNQNVSGEYVQLLNEFVDRLQDAVCPNTQGHIAFSPKMANALMAMSRKCENSLELLVLSRALPPTDEFPKSQEYDALSRSSTAPRVSSIVNFNSTRNPQVSLDPSISTDYASHVKAFTGALNYAYSQGTNSGTYIDGYMAKVYSQLCRRAANSLQVLLLSRAMSDEAQVVYDKVLQENTRDSFRHNN